MNVGTLVMKMIKSMTFDELIKTKAEVEAAIQLHIAGEHRQLLEAIGKLASAHTKETRAPSGLRRHALKGTKLAPRYRNPKDRRETWAGRGHRPRWLVAALKGGKKLEAFAIR